MQLKSIDSHTFWDKWQNTVTIDSLSLTLRDDNAPTADPVRGRWPTAAGRARPSPSA